MPWIQLIPGTKSDACTSAQWPFSSKIRAIHSAHVRSAWVYDQAPRPPSSPSNLSRPDGRRR